MNKRMLIIPGAFVPANDTVTLLTYRRLKHLDIEKNVLALKQVPDSYIQKQLDKDIHYKSFNIEYCMNYENTICINHPIRLPIGLINMQRYILKAYKKSKQKHYDYLYTSSIPGISHICGNKIKKHNPNIKWFASFSDPIKNSPYKEDPFLKKRGFIYKLLFKVGSFVYMNNKYEEITINNADKLIFICEEQRNFTANQYPNKKKEILEKSMILPLCYDESWDIYKDMLESRNTCNKPKKAVHLGRIYGLRRIDAFLEALKELKEKDKDLGKKIVFYQYSEIQKEDVVYIKENKLEDVFVIKNKVSYSDSLKIMEEADILVLFDTLMPKAKVQPYLPSKIVEYLLLKKEILAICGENSPSYRILKEYNYKHIGYSKEDIKNSIIDLIGDSKDRDYEITSMMSYETNKELIKEVNH